MLTFIAQSSLGTLQPPTTAYSEGSTASETAVSNLESFISAMIGLLTILGGIFFIVYFLLAALKWITAGGDSGKVGKARDQMIQGVLGLVVIIAAYSVVGLIGTILGLNLLAPGQEILNLSNFQ